MKLEFMFGSGGIGWHADCLSDPDAPPLASRIALALMEAQRLWDHASAAERQEFEAWLCPD